MQKVSFRQLCIGAFLTLTSKQVNYLPAEKIALKASAGSFDLCGECYIIIT